MITLYIYISLYVQIYTYKEQQPQEVDGAPTSLCDLGFCDVGLDDAWQARGCHVLLLLPTAAYYCYYYYYCCCYYYYYCCYYFYYYCYHHYYHYYHYY